MIFTSKSKEEKEDIKFLNSIIISKGLEFFDEKTISTFQFTNEHVSFLKECIQFESLELLYRFTRDGTTFDKFKPKIIDIGDTITIVKSNHGKVFGGYASIAWKNSGSHMKDPKAFIFSLTNLYKYDQIDVNQNAIYQHNEGIFWGESCKDLYLHFPANG